MISTHIKAMTISCLLMLSTERALANCWNDPALIGLANSIAQSKFPNTAGQMPNILVCADYDFPPNVGGQYTGGLHQITVPARSLGQDIRTIVTHELAHAEVALIGGSGGDLTAGHGRDWMRVMVGAGEGAEAQRIAGYYQQQGGYNELVIAQQSLGQYPPPAFAGAMPYLPPTYQPTCVIRPYFQVLRFAHGVRVQLIQNGVSCQ